MLNLSNPCSFCSAECCKTYVITVTSFDVVRIIKATGKKAEDFACLYEARLLTYDPDMIFDFSDFARGHILGLKSHPCCFLDKQNKCEIHDFAPLCCKKYPYHLGNKLNARFCSIASKIWFAFRKPDIGDGQILKELEEYRKIVAEWNKKSGKKKDCLEFLVSRTAKISRD